MSCVLSVICPEDVLINMLRNAADDSGNETPDLACSHFQGTEKKCTSPAKLFVAELAFVWWLCSELASASAVRDGVVGRM